MIYYRELTMYARLDHLFVLLSRPDRETVMIWSTALGGSCARGNNRPHPICPITRGTGKPAAAITSHQVNGLPGSA